MTDLTHEILSAVHHLLSLATEDELRRTANVAITSPHIRVALNALADERASTSQIQDNVTWVQSSRKATNKIQDDAQNRLKGDVSEADNNTLAAALTKSFANHTKSGIQQACLNIGLQLTIKPKETRERYMRRLAGMLVRLPEDQRKKALTTLMAKVDSQTDGWVSVIRRKE